MKKQGRSWGEKGGTGMIHIITGMKNGDLAQAFINGGIRINKKNEPYTSESRRKHTEEA